MPRAVDNLRAVKSPKPFPLRCKRVGWLASLSLVAVATAADSTKPATTQTADGLDTVVISTRREIGGVVGDVAPDLRLSPTQIASYGASSVAELLQAIGPQIQSSRGDGPPVVLINGARVSGFAEVRDIPPEAILRLDVFPEELSIKYGYRPDQRVVNFVLRPRFRAVSAELGGREASAGGRRSTDFEGGGLRVQRDDRWQITTKWRHDDALLESERDVRDANGQTPVDAALRTLLPATNQYSLNGLLARAGEGGRSTTFNATFDDTRNSSALGLVAGRPVRRDDELQVGRLAAIVNGATRGWRWSATGAVDRTLTDSATQADALAITHSRLQGAEGSGLLIGSPFGWRAGSVNMTAKVALGERNVASDTTRGGIARAVDLSRRTVDGQLSVDVPLTERSSSIGGLSVNFNLGSQNLSDFGGLRSDGVGVTWNPSRQWRWVASYTQDDVAPTMQQLGDPVLATPGVRVFDFVRGETVFVTRLDGGDATLRAGRRNVGKLGFSTQPFESLDLSLNANYVLTDARNLPTALSVASTAAQAVFTNRFVRDASGRLTSIDARPINLARRERGELRWGFNLNMPWGPQPEAPAFGRRDRDAGTPAGARSGEGQSDRPRGASGGGPPNVTPEMRDRMMSFARRGSIQLSVNHTLRVRDDVQLAPGQSTLDLLHGASLSESFGQPTQEIEAQLAFMRNGLNGRITAQWRDATEIRGNALRSDLRYGALTTINLRLFADLGLQPFARNLPSLRAARVSLQVNNLLDTRPKVRAGDGSTPLNFQSELLDPVGRSVRLNVRKLFF